MNRCAIILLAAGGSSRLGSAKQLVPFNSVPLIVHSVQTALDTTCRPVIVVLGSTAEQFEPLIANLEVEIIRNEHWANGMGTSIRAGMSQIESSSVDAVMILLCDQPLIQPKHLRAMFEAFGASGKSIAAARYNGVFGTPAIFSSAHFAELKALGDAQGGKTVIQRHLNQVHPFDLPEAAVDLDTPDDLKSLIGARGGQQGG